MPDSVEGLATAADVMALTALLLPAERTRSDPLFPISGLITSLQESSSSAYVYVNCD